MLTAQDGFRPGGMWLDGPAWFEVLRRLSDYTLIRSNRFDRISDRGISSDRERYAVLARLIAAVSLTGIAVLFKRLVTRKRRPLPYRKAESDWPRHSYRDPSSRS